MRKPAYLGLVTAVAALAVLLTMGQAQAILSHTCVDCHTMHNSQDGTSMATMSQGGAADATPNGALIRFDGCYGCHTNATDATTVITHTPIVYNATTAPSPMLAGGNFYYGVSNADTKIHNCVGDADLIGPPGFAAATKPAGFTQSGTGWGPTTWGISEVGLLTCAGKYGCHGDRSVENTESFSGIRGAHHGNNSMTSAQACDSASTVATSYRFLAGIWGVEQNDSDNSWEYTVTSTKHNAYYGLDDPSRAQIAGLGSHTISALCAQCHGSFHSAAGTGGASPWLRHPTDIAMPTAAADEFDNYNVGGAEGEDMYNPIVPVGFNDVLAANAIDPNVTTGANIVLCLSCHRAHGSNYNDLLRWSYTGAAPGYVGVDQPATNSCRTCHTAH